MSFGAVQKILVAFIVGVLLTGAVLAFRLALDPKQRARWLGTNRLPAWPMSLADFGVLLLTVCASVYFVLTVVRIVFGQVISHATDRAGWEVLVYTGVGLNLGILAGWAFFPLLRRYWQVSALPPGPAPGEPKLPWNKVLLYGAGTLVMSYAVLVPVNFAWGFALQKLGLPDEPQPLIAIFAQTKSPFVIGGLIVVACVIGPWSEEMLFRAGLYRFCRQSLGRGWSLLLCGSVFGAVHGNLAGFLPLALFGALLGLAYEATGDIRVTVTAHGLFNLITCTLIFAGLPS